MNVMRIYLILPVLLISALPGFAQPDSLWSRIYDGAGSAGVRSVDECNNGDIIAAGKTSNGPGTYLSSWIARFTSSGDLIWERIEGGWFSDYTYHIEETLDGGLISCGGTWSYSPFGNWDGFVRKLTADGDVEWVRRIGTENAWDDITRVRALADGTYIACAHSGNTPWVVRLGPNGGVIWSSISDLISGMVVWIEPTSDSGFVVSGGHSGDLTPLIYKLDNDGNVLWESTTLPDPEMGVLFNCVRESTNEDLIACGRVRIGDQIQFNKGYVAKLTHDGDLVWNQVFEGVNNCEFYELILPPDGSIMVAGLKDYTNAWFMKLDEEGEVLWEWVQTDAEFLSLTQLSDGSYVAGGRMMPAVWDHDLHLVRFEPEVQITLTPAGSGTIPPGGGTILYDGQVGHILTIPTTLDAWVTVIAPSGQTIPMQQTQITLQPNQWPLFTGVQVNVPGWAPPGQYTYEVHIGDLQTGGNMGLGSFTFVKQGQ